MAVIKSKDLPRSFQRGPSLTIREHVKAELAVAEPDIRQHAKKGKMRVYYDINMLARHLMQSHSGIRVLQPRHCSIMCIHRLELKSVVALGRPDWTGKDCLMRESGR